MADDRPKRRYEIGDKVRFRAQSRVPFSFDIDGGEIGTVTGVEPQPAATGPTYRIEVRFSRALVPYTFEFEYELVSPENLSLEGRATSRVSASGSIDGLGWMQRIDATDEVIRNQAAKRHELIAKTGSYGINFPLPPLAEQNTTHTLEASPFVEAAKASLQIGTFSPGSRKPEEILNTVRVLLSEIKIEIDRLRATAPNEQERQKAQNDLIVALEKIAANLEAVANALDRAINASPKIPSEKLFQAPFLELVEESKEKLLGLLSRHPIITDLSIRVPLALAFYQFLTLYSVSEGAAGLVGGILGSYDFQKYGKSK